MENTINQTDQVVEQYFEENQGNKKINIGNRSQNKSLGFSALNHSQPRFIISEKKQNKLCSFLGCSNSLSSNNISKALVNIGEESQKSSNEVSSNYGTGSELELSEIVNPDCNTEYHFISQSNSGQNQNDKIIQLELENKKLRKTLCKLVARIHFLKEKDKINEEIITSKNNEIQNDKKLYKLQSRINKPIISKNTLENEIINGALHGRRENFEIAKVTLKLRHDINSLYFLSKIYYLEGQYDENISTLCKVMDLQLDYEYTYIDLGYSFYKKGCFKQAREYFLVAFQTWKNQPFPHVYYMLGKMSLNEENLDETKILFEKVLNLDDCFPKKEFILLTIARIYYQKKNIDTAMSFLNQIKEIPNYHKTKYNLLFGMICIETKNINEINNNKELLLTLDNSNDESIYLSLYDLNKITNFLKASTYIQKAIIINGTNSEYLCLKGEVLEKMGEKNLAEIQYVNALKLNVKDIHALLKLAKIKIDKIKEVNFYSSDYIKYDEINIKISNFAINEDINYICLNNLGKDFQDINEFEMAEYFFKAVIGDNSENENALINLTILYIIQKNTEEARKFGSLLFERISDTTFNALLLFANLLSENGQYFEADSVYKKLCLEIGSNINKCKTLNILGLMHLKNNELEKAKKSFIRAVNILNNCQNELEQGEVKSVKDEVQLNLQKVYKMKEKEVESRGNSNISTSD